MNRLADKVALITGASGGIGRAAAECFAAEGARLGLVDLDPGAVEEVVAAVGAERAIALPGDVTDDAAVAASVARTVERFGRLDVAFLNAGIEGAVERLTDYPLEMFDKVLAVNVRGVFLGLRHVIPVMQQGGGGSIVLTSSLAGLRGSPKLSAYVASKHAVVGLMKTAALECARHNIRVNTINPAPIATRMIASLEQGYAPGAGEAMKEKMEKAVPLRRYGTPAEVARLALFLASDESSYVTGNCYPIDGGMSAG